MALPWRAVTAVCAVLFLSCGCLSPASGSTGPSLEHLIVVVLSGFSDSRFDAQQSPHLSALAENGATCRVRSVFPAESFPNQYSLLTGLPPSGHGVLWNRMFESSRGKEQVVDAWSSPADVLLHGELIWHAAQKEQLHTAIFTNGVRKGNGSLDKPCIKCNPVTLVNNVVLWHASSISADPSVGTLSVLTLQPDLESQHDLIVGKLVKKLKQQKLDQVVNVIVTGDYGLVASKPRQVVCLPSILADLSYEVVDYSGGAVSLRPTGNTTVLDILGPLELENRVKAMVPLAVARNFMKSRTERLAPVTVFAQDDSVVIADKNCVDVEGLKSAPSSRSGFRTNEAMVTRFFGTGPKFVRGASAAMINISSIHSIMCRVLRLKSASCSGLSSSVQPLLRSDQELELDSNEHVADESNMGSGPKVISHRQVTGFGVFVIILSGSAFLGAIYWMKNYFAERRNQNMGYRPVKNAFEPDLTLRTEPLLGNGNDGSFRGDSLQLSVMGETSRVHVISSDDDDPPDSF